MAHQQKITTSAKNILSTFVKKAKITIIKLMTGRLTAHQQIKTTMQ